MNLIIDQLIELINDCLNQLINPLLNYLISLIKLNQLRDQFIDEFN